MTIKKLSKKQRTIFTWAYNPQYSGKKGIIADGAVRTGKTVCMAAAFLLWAMKSYTGKSFGICGKTIRSAERNIIRPLEDLRDITRYFRLTFRRSESLLIVIERKTGRENRFYIFGGRDDSSYMLIQGITLSGVMFDEAALMPESFIEQAAARTISVPDSKLWFNCNPDSTRSYFYQNWILKADEKQLLRVTLLMHDNPILTPKQIADAERMYSGVFRDRYIYGKWVNAEGLIYREFAENPAAFFTECTAKTADSTADTIKKSGIIYGTIGLDFGGNGSAHAAVLTGFTKGYGKIVVLDEFYLKETITPARLEAEVVEFAKKALSVCMVREMYCDSAEQVLIKGLKSAFRNARLPIEVKNARKGPILDRIAFENRIISTGQFAVAAKCKHLTDALCTAVWSADGHRLDDGSINIDSLDAFEYSFESVMKNYI
jgi:PBSX family phage terminase large subunit